MVPHLHKSYLEEGIQLSLLKSQLTNFGLKRKIVFISQQDKEILSSFKSNGTHVGPVLYPPDLQDRILVAVIAPEVIFL